METTNKRRENLTWPDEDKTRKQLEAIRELAKELRTDYPTDTPDEPTNWSNKARNRRNAIIRVQFLDDFGFTLINGSMWLELFDLLGFSVDSETRKRFASHLKWYSFGYANFKPRISRKYAQRIHWYVHNFLFCLRNELQTEKDYREGKYGSKGQAYFMEIEQQPATPTETPRISTETAETTELSAEATKVEEAPKYSISERDGNVYVTFKRGVIRQCAKRCGVSCKSAEWNTIAQAYNGTHSDMGMGLSFFFDGREDAVRFAELVCNGDISGYYKLYMDKIIAEGEARKKRIAEKCAEYDAAQAYFAECMADEDAETVNVSDEGENAAETKENCHSDTRIVSDGYGTQYEVTRHWENGRIESLDVIVLGTQLQTATEPPQSRDTPQTVECTTDTPKPRETAEKRQNRAIGSAQHRQHSALGANGYAMLDNASATLTAMHVPRECSTADAAYW